MTRRVLQAIAGAAHGGAEIFFTRLAAALQRAGEPQRVLIRRHSRRAKDLRAAGVGVGELAFGGIFDVATRLAFGREIAAWRHLIGNTRAIVDYAIAKGWPRERITHLPNFVPDAAAAAGNVAPGERAPLALAVGRLHPNKGFDLLLEALAATREVTLWIAGDGPLRPRLERLATRLGIIGRVRFLGWREDVPRLLAAADLLVCPSLHEPLGNVVIEAWSAGLPVVATASDGPAGLIRDGESGILVPLPGSRGGGPQALADAIERVCADPALRARLGKAGRRAYEAEFTEPIVVAGYRSFFDQMTR
ncbi:MAG: glycosyltransferase [Alphaproteobacteria bacterium]|nr:MAG: glycosyltransferase [Alphaproteobacteria bacterium]